MPNRPGKLRGVPIGISGRGSDTLVGADLRKTGIKGNVAAGVSRDVLGTDKGLSLAVSGRINGIVGKELDPVGCVRRTVEPAPNGCHPAAVRDRGEDGEILQIVATRIGIAGVVQSDAVAI